MMGMMMQVFWGEPVMVVKVAEVRMAMACWGGTPRQIIVLLPILTVPLPILLLLSLLFPWWNGAWWRRRHRTTRMCQSRGRLARVLLDLLQLLQPCRSRGGPNPFCGGIDETRGRHGLSRGRR